MIMIVLEIFRKAEKSYWWITHLYSGIPDSHYIEWGRSVCAVIEQYLTYLSSETKVQVMYTTWSHLHFNGYIKIAYPQTISGIINKELLTLTISEKGHWQPKVKGRMTSRINVCTAWIFNMCTYCTSNFWKMNINEKQSNQPTLIDYTLNANHFAQ